VRKCEATRGDFTIRIANKRVRADNLFNVIVKDASTPFANIARLCINLQDDALRALYNLIEDKFDLFPMRLIDSNVNYHTWALVDNTRTYDGRALTADHMREKITAIKRSAISNVDRNEDDDDDDDDDNDDDDDDNNVVVTAPDARSAVVEPLLSQQSSSPPTDANITAPQDFVPRSASGNAEDRASS